MDTHELMATEEVRDLRDALVAVRTPEQAEALLLDLCTAKELDDLAQRLHVAKLLRAGDSYLAVQRATGASSTTVSRVSKCLNGEAGGYRTVLDALATGALDVSAHDLEWLGDKIPGGFFVYHEDERRELVYANEQTLKIFGCETLDEFKELTGYTFPCMVHPDDFERIQASIDDQIHGGAGSSFDNVEYRIVRKDGAVRWVSDYGRFVRTPDMGDLYYVFISDITEKFELQAERLRMQMELEREHYANELKTHFLFNMSHDLRTPMNSIMGYARLAQNHLDEPERVRTCLNKINASSEQLLSLIDDLLEMNELESGELHLNLAPAHLSENLGEVVDSFSDLARGKGVELSWDAQVTDDLVLVDADRARRVLFNLVSNAVKFTQRGGTVRCTLRQKPHGSSDYARYVIEVADTGQGMSEAFLRRLFDAFEREESSTLSGEAGTGLGLTITKSLLAIMGGSISVRSVKGEGSTFTVVLPLRVADDAPQPEELQAEAARPSERPYRVLVVEDVELNRSLAEAVLEEGGFLFESVVDGREAVRAVDEHPLWYYDLVLMDIQMPVMDGYAATRAIRALPRADVVSLPIVALSANAREEDRRMSLESGMDDHVAKPFDFDGLLNTISEHIARRGEQQG